jgi:predicted aconitase
MRLTEHERRMYDGELGEPTRLAIEQQIAVGDFFGAERFVPVTSVHMMGDMEVMGEAGFGFIERLGGLGACFVAPVTTNARQRRFRAGGPRAAAARAGRARGAARGAPPRPGRDVGGYLNYQRW